MSIYQLNMTRNIFISMAAAALLLLVNPAFADTPDSLKGTQLVDAAKAKSLIDGGAVAIDARVANEFAEAHIKGAQNVPYKEKSAKSADFDASKDSFDLSKLPADKNASLVIYCNGPECWKSYKASEAAVKGGYKNVHWFRTGMPAWKAAGYPTE
jgi:rhodanese-related sulfurtransferase